MKGVVITVIVFFACGQVVPTVGKADAVVVAQVQEKTQFRACSWEALGKGHVVVQPGIVVDGRVSDIGLARATHGTHQRQAQLAKSGQPSVRLFSIKGKIIL